MSIELVSFDLDNTLWDSDSVIRLATEKLSQWLSENEPRYVEIDASTHRELHAQIADKHPEVLYDVTANRVRHLEASFFYLGYRQDTAYQLAVEGFNVFSHWRCQVTPYPESIPVLEELSAKYKLASITNGNSNISQTSIAQFFSLNVDAATAGAAKPDAQIFEYTLRQAGLDNPTDVVHVGDSYEADYRGAIAAGMHAILYDPLQNFDQDSVKIVAHKLAQLPTLIAAVG